MPLMTVPLMVSRDSLPELSLAVAIYGGADAQGYADWLSSADAATLARIEVIIASNVAVSFRAPPGAAARVIVRSGAPPVKLWGAAVAAACGTHIALLDGHAVPMAGWLEAMLEAMEGGGDRFWGPVICNYAPDDRRMIGYLTEYAQFHPPIAPGLREIPGNNLIIRHPGEAARDDLRSNGFSKTALIETWAPQSDDWPVHVYGASVMHDRMLNRRAYIARRYRHGRSYGGNRAMRESAVMRLALAARLIALPFVRVARIGRHARRTPILARGFLRHLPTIVVAETAWSIGEFAGTLFGVGTAAERID
jgi:hypothetical protein